jgi:hydroxymethylpyrimidine pyrophosphatase-like HAD family hydrolase
MENSPADLLDVADAVVPNIENDGAAAAIERYVLDRS